MSETGDTDALAAEYVLGTLDAGERAQTQAMLTVDQALAAKVRIWERRLSELHLMVEPVDPDSEIWDRIKAKMTLVAPVVPPPEPVAEPAPATARTGRRTGTAAVRTVAAVHAARDAEPRGDRGCADWRRNRRASPTLFKVSSRLRSRRPRWTRSKRSKRLKP